ncbi:MAG TPA: hypothetical protein VK253_03130, partial [Candidatus Binatia bacterium]|nr:hypothetical protein [Candidatus Binatia bacterium]
TPVTAPEKPLVAKLMAIAAEKAGVGPMAAVAGAIADLAVEDMKLVGCEVAVVEDGGEISCCLKQTRRCSCCSGRRTALQALRFSIFRFPNRGSN